MRRDLMEFLACPTCKGNLVLEVEVEEDEQIIEGILQCAPCETSYPIEDAIPNMLPPGTTS